MIIFLQESTGAWYTDSKIKHLDISFYWNVVFLVVTLFLPEYGNCM